MKIKIYTDCPIKLYYEGVYRLKDLNKVEDVELIGTRFFYYIYIKLNNKFKLFRKIRKIFNGKENVIKNEPTSEILKSLCAPFKLLFYRNIILSISACRNSIYYLYLLKFLNKNLIFYSSWPYYGKEWIIKPRLWNNEFLWKLFFKNIKAIGINKDAARGMTSLGAKTCYIPHSVDTSLFKPKEKKNKKIVVLYVGRLIEAKGIYSILNLANQFHKEAKFIFIGSGPLEDDVKNNKNVEFLGKIEDREKLAEIYGNADIFILNSYKTPEWEEVFGRVLIEAMSAGLAVLSTDCIGPKEILMDGKNGILIEQKNDKQLFINFQLLLKDKNLRKKLGSNARKDVLEKYDINKIAEKWLEVIKR